MDFEAQIRYRVVREIAAGGMGRVLEVEQFGAEGFVKRVAMKEIHAPLAATPEFQTMFIGEARLVADLIHPNIVQIYQLDRRDDAFYIVMELIDGMTLEGFQDLHRACGRQVRVDMAAFIASRIARGLEYAHGKRDARGRRLGVVHRDVSPRNVLITSEGEVKLADFGVAKAAHYLEAREGDQVYGKLEYMAPEQAACQPTTAKSDVYSLGMVWYELLAGTNPVRGDTFAGTLARVLQPELAPIASVRAGIPRSFQSILARCLSPDPKGRYTSRQLSHVIESALYAGGYGPTIVRLARYIRNLQGKSRAAPKSRGRGLQPGTHRKRP